jgi:hypothetical protein
MTMIDWMFADFIRENLEKMTPEKRYQLRRDLVKFAQRLDDIRYDE